MIRRSLRRAIAIACFASAAALSAPAFADVPISENARIHFRAGVNLLQDPGGARYEDAYREFKTAFADSPSPRILGNMALCAMKLERDGEAMQSYEAYLAGVPDMSADEKRQTLTDLGTLRAGAARLSLKINPAKASLVDVRVPVTGSSVTNVYAIPATGALELAVRPGHHAITVKAEGYEPQTFEVEATPGAKVEHTFTLDKSRDIIAAPVLPESPRPTVKTRPIPTALYIAGGASLAFAAGGVITGSLALKQNSDFQTANTGTNPTNAASIRSTGLALNVLTDILFVGAIVGGGITTYLYVARPTVESDAGAASQAKSSSSNPPGLAALSFTTSPAGVTLQGTF